MSDQFPEIRCEPRRVWWIWPVYLVLYSVAIPWYWPAAYRGPIWFGFPAWAATTLAGVVLLAAFTSWVVARYWRVIEEEDERR